jgi:hypothetical protein
MRNVKKELQLVFSHIINACFAGIAAHSLGGKQKGQDRSCDPGLFVQLDRSH